MTEPLTPNQTNPIDVLPNQNSLPWYKDLFNKIKPLLEPLFNKIYSNKLIFWSVCILFGLIFLIIILGLLFGKKTQKTVIIKPSPVPFILATPAPVSDSTVISIAREELNKIKDDTNQVDVRQRKLQPPNINFDIKF